MICSKCNSKWETKQLMTNCPFCGEKLSNNDNADISDVIHNLIEQKGVECLKNHKLVYSYIVDLVAGKEREKRLLKIAFSNGLLDVAALILSKKDKNQQEILIRKIIKDLQENAFLSTENSIIATNVMLRGIGFEPIELQIPTSTTKTTAQASNRTNIAPQVNASTSNTDEHQYTAACKLMKEAETKRELSKIEHSIDLFKLLDDYKDSKAKCKLGEEIRLSILYENAIQEKKKYLSYKDADMIERVLSQTKSMFLDLGNYRDSVEQAADCDVLAKQAIYDLAKSVLESAEKYKDETIFSKAMMLFGRLRNYMDAEDLHQYCRQQLQIAHQESEYKKANVLIEKGDAFSLQLASECLKQLGRYKDSYELLKQIEHSITKSQRKKQELCSYCGGVFKKTFFKGLICSKCGKPKDY